MLVHNGLLAEKTGGLVGGKTGGLVGKMTGGLVVGISWIGGHSRNHRWISWIGGCSHLRVSGIGGYNHQGRVVGEEIGGLVRTKLQSNLASVA